MTYDLIIIGGGPGGITAGIYAARQKLKTLLITKEFGGQIAEKAVMIENYTGFKEISGPELIQKFIDQLKSQEIEIKEEEVRKVEKKNGKFLVFTKSENKYETLAVIISSGADPRPLEVPGEKEFIGRGVSYCVTCLPSGEEVVANNSVKTIDRIGISEKVLTTDGTFENINQIIGLDFNGEVVQIKTRFFREPVKLTSNHLILTAKLDRTFHLKRKIASKPQWKKAIDLSSDDLVLYPIIIKTIDVRKISFAEILDVEVKNGIVRNNQETYTSVRLKNEIPVNDEFLRLAGYYLSEGALGVHHLNFYFYKKEKKYIQDVEKIIKNIFGLKPIIKIEGNVARITISSKLIRDLFQVLFGKNAPNKSIPHWMYFLPQEKQKELLKGIHRGDGCIRYKDFEITTTSRILAYQLRDILLRFKIICGIDKQEKEKLNRTPSEIGGRKIRFNHDRYHVRVGGYYLGEMGEILGIIHPRIKQRKRTFKHAWIKGKYLYLPITEIKKEKYKGKVYNLLVDKNNTFVAKNFIVHNCDGPLFKNKVIAVIGGGNAGFEAAIFMTNYAKKIYILEYGPEVKADRINQEIAKKSGKIEVITNAAVKEIKGDKFVNSIIFQDLKTKKDTELKVEGVFVEIGTQPVTSFAKGLVDFNEIDEIKVEFETYQTKTSGLFAVGDCNVGKYKQIITAAGEGCKAALAAYEYIKSLGNYD